MWTLLKWLIEITEKSMNSVCFEMEEDEKQKKIDYKRRNIVSHLNFLLIHWTD